MSGAVSWPRSTILSSLRAFYVGLQLQVTRCLRYFRTIFFISYRLLECWLMVMWIIVTADEFPVSFAIIVVGATFSFIAVVCLLILTSSNHRCCRSTPTDTRRTAVPTVSARALHEPRLVGFATVNRRPAAAAPAADSVERSDLGVTLQPQQKDQRRRHDTEQTDPTSAETKSRHRQPRRDNNEITLAASTSRSMYTRSLSAPAMTDSNDNRTTADSAAGLMTQALPVSVDTGTSEVHQPSLCANRVDSDVSGLQHSNRKAGIDPNASVIQPSLSTAKVDSGVSEMQSSLCTLSTSSTSQPQITIETDPRSTTQFADCADASSPVWNESQTSMDVRSCPGGTESERIAVLRPPLFLYQYVNGYSEAMLTHVGDRQRGSTWDSGDVSTDATHCDGEGAAHGAHTVQTKAVVEPPRTANDENQLPGVCVEYAQDPLPMLSSIHHQQQPSPKCVQESDRMSSVCEHILHARQPASNVSCTSIHKRDHNHPLSPVNAAVHEVKAVPPSLSSDVDRRRLLTRLLLGRHEELVLSPVFYDETYFWLPFAGGPSTTSNVNGSGS